MGTITRFRGVPLRLINPLESMRREATLRREPKDRDLEVLGDARILETNRKSITVK